MDSSYETERLLVPENTLNDAFDTGMDSVVFSDDIYSAKVQFFSLLIHEIVYKNSMNIYQGIIQKKQCFFFITLLNLIHFECLILRVFNKTVQTYSIFSFIPQTFEINLCLFF
jgi:hypothetical protein